MHVPGSLVLDFLPSPLSPTESNTQAHILRLNNILKTTLEEKAGIWKGIQKPPALARKPSIEKLSIRKWIDLQNRNRLTDTENRLVVAKGDRGGRRKDCQFGVSRCNLLDIGWINKKVLLCTTGICIWCPVIINHNGKRVHVCITESLCYTAEINTVINQLYVNRRIFYKLSAEISLLGIHLEKCKPMFTTKHVQQCSEQHYFYLPKLCPKTSCVHL